MSMLTSIQKAEYLCSKPSRAEQLWSRSLTPNIESKVMYNLLRFSWYCLVNETYRNQHQNTTTEVPFTHIYIPVLIYVHKLYFNDWILEPLQSKVQRKVAHEACTSFLHLSSPPSSSLLPTWAHPYFPPPCKDNSVIDQQTFCNCYHTFWNQCPLFWDPAIQNP